MGWSPSAGRTRNGEVTGRWLVDWAGRSPSRSPPLDSLHLSSRFNPIGKSGASEWGALGELGKEGEVRAPHGEAQTCAPRRSISRSRLRRRYLGVGDPCCTVVRLATSQKASQLVVGPTLSPPPVCRAAFPIPSTTGPSGRSCSSAGLPTPPESGPIGPCLVLLLSLRSFASADCSSSLRASAPGTTPACAHSETASRRRRPRQIAPPSSARLQVLSSAACTSDPNSLFPPAFGRPPRSAPSAPRSP